MQSTSAVPSWLAEFNDRIAAFSNAIGVDESKVRSALAELGIDGKTDQSLSMIESDEYLPISDLFVAFLDSGLAQKARLRMGISCLRGKNQIPASENNSVSSAIEKLIASNRPKSDWSDEELLAKYNEDETEIHDILRRRSRGRHFVVFNADGSVNTSVSLSLLKVAKRQATSDRHGVDGKTVRVWRAGEFIAKPIDESPLFPGSALVNGYCAKSGTDWSNISNEGRILARIYITQVDGHLNKMDMKKICSAAKDVDAFRQEYSEAAMIYDELAEKDQLPKLKINSVVENKRDTGF